MKATIETITPEQAAKWLKGNEMNRPLRHHSVQRYARDMESGNWLENGQAIVFNGRKLIDGQHRLAACIQAGVPFKSIVVYGVSPDAQTTIDTGMSRSLSDTLRFKGEQNAAVLGGIIGTTWRWTRGHVGRTYIPTRSEALEWLDLNPSLRGVTSLVLDGARKPLKWSPTISGAIVFMASKSDPDAAEAFYRLVYTGEDMTAGNPALTLRNRLIDNTTSTTKLPFMTTFAFSVKAWNAWVLGEPLHRLIWQNSTKNKASEPFPALLDASGYEITPPIG